MSALAGLPREIRLSSVGDDGVVEVYAAPPPDRSPLKKDAWWSRHYLKVGQRGAPVGNSSYRKYRDSIDGLLVDVVKALAPDRGKVSELCAGDGSLATAVLSERPDLGTYVMIERNARLSKLAAANTSAASATTSVVSVGGDACALGWADAAQNRGRCNTNWNTNAYIQMYARAIAE